MSWGSAWGRSWGSSWGQYAKPEPIKRSAWRYWVNDREFRRTVSARDIELYGLTHTFRSIDEALDYLKRSAQDQKPRKKSRVLKQAKQQYQNTLYQIELDTPEFDLSIIKRSADAHQNYQQWAKDARRVLQAYAYFLWRRNEEATLALLLAS